MTKPTDTAVLKPTAAAGSSTETAMAKFTWQQVKSNPSTGSGLPLARYDHAIAFDSDQQRLVLFGGRDGSNTFGDTWTFDLNAQQWREVKTQGPSPRFGFAAAYDPKRKMVFIFGGQKSEFYNDTWAFDTTSETWREIKTEGAKPDIRYGHGVALDTVNDRLIVSHGFARDGRHDDTWALDLDTNQWSNISPQGERPLKRCLLETAFAPALDTLYLFGGCSSGFGPCPQGDFWAFDSKTGKWTQIQASGDAPSARENPSLVMDEKQNRLVLFGGKGGSPLNDLWTFDLSTNAWQKIAVEGPSARKSHDAAYDAVHQRVYLFGGNTVNGAVNDLWFLEL